jgi:pyruvate dehydrogenase E2 component (dihydrolipoamide acetyltransferase)
MAEIIRMPRMSDTMTDGIIIAWHKKVGDAVKPGDLMAEVETDKATMELESYQSGTILHIGAEAGKSVAVDGLLAVIGKPGEDFAALLAGGNSPAPAAPPAPVAAATAPQPAAAPAPAPATTAPALDLTKMEQVILMPRMSDTMTEGIIAAWHKKVGDKVKSGELLAEVETDKATMELESYQTGTLLYIGVQPGAKVPVNGLLAIIGEEGKIDINAVIAAAAGGGTSAGAAAETTVAAVTAAPAAAEAATAGAVTENGRVKASPLARKLAADKGIDLKAVQGSGDGGRIIKKDVDGFTPAAAAASVAAPVTESAKTAAPAVTAFVAGQEGHHDTPNSQMRKTIARRLSESMFTAPHFYLKMEVVMDNAMAARKAMNDISPVKISFQDMMIKACAMALRLHPAVNSSWMGDFIRTYNHIHIGSAVAVEEGLIVPVFKFADQKSLSQIASEANDLYGKAKSKKLQPHEFSGNTFTISNLGMMDIDEFTAIINPPDSCILAVGKIKEVVVRKGDGFGVNNVMTLTLSCDHRIVDGAVGARFLQTLKAFLENPAAMLV